MRKEVVMHGMALVSKKNRQPNRLISKEQKEEITQAINSGQVLQRFTLVAKRIDPKKYNFGIALCSSKENFIKKSGATRAYINAEDNPIAVVILTTKDDLKNVHAIGKTLLKEVAENFNKYKKLQENFNKRRNFSEKKLPVKKFTI